MFLIGLVLWLVAGGELGAIVHGGIHLGDSDGGSVAEFVIGINALPWTAIIGGALLHTGRRKRLGLETVGPTEAALARVESSKAVGEGPDFPVRLDLTVAPTNRPAFRVDAKSSVNLMDLDRLQPGRNVVVDYDPLRPWKVSVRRDPGVEWIERVTITDIATAAEDSRAKEPALPAGRRTWWYGLAAAVVGFVLWWVLF